MLRREVGLGGAVGPAAAQRFVLGVAGVGGDYREATNNLRYDVAGLGVSGLLMLGRFAAEAAVTGLTYTPDEGGTATAEFSATQFDGYLRYRMVRWLSLELGVTNRAVQDDLLAQSSGAFRMGLHSDVALGPSAGVAARLNYLAGAQFSGGGSAPVAMDVGLSFFYALARGRLRVTGESQFQLYDREVDVAAGTADVPIQQMTGRLGLAVAF